MPFDKKTIKSNLHQQKIYTPDIGMTTSTI